MGFHKPLIRPIFSGGGTWPGGGRLTSHDCWLFVFLLRCCLYQSIDSDFYRGSSASPQGFCVHSHRGLFALGFNAFKSCSKAMIFTNILCS